LPPDDLHALPPLKPVVSPNARLSQHATIGENTPDMDHPLKRSEIACWQSHVEVLRQIAVGKEETAIIFEDDVDMEFDLEKRLRGMWQFLPKDSWDMVMLGHCQSDETHKPPVPGNSYLHPAQHALCTHAYAVSRLGAARLVRLLRMPLFAYSRPIDHAYIHLNWHGMINAFSVYPPVVVQSKATLSDIGQGTGPQEEFHLVDSALARVKAWRAQ